LYISFIVYELSKYGNIAKAAMWIILSFL